MAKQIVETKNSAERVIFFDFDGTIADSFDGMMEVFNKMANEYGYDKIDKKDIDAFRKLSLRDIIKKFAIPKWKLPLIIYRARKIFNKRLPSILMVPGMKEVLRELKKRQYCLGILTSNSEKNVRDFLTRQGIDFFDFIFSESSLFGKDKALKKIVQNHGWDTKRFFYVGDETRDVEAAKKSGVSSVAVCWGFNSESILKEYAVDHIVRKPRGLLRIF